MAARPTQSRRVEPSIEADKDVEMNFRPNRTGRHAIGAVIVCAAFSWVHLAWLPLVTAAPQQPVTIAGGTSQSHQSPNNTPPAHQSPQRTDSNLRNTPEAWHRNPARSSPQPAVPLPNYDNSSVVTAAAAMPVFQPPSESSQLENSQPNGEAEQGIEKRRQAGTSEDLNRAFTSTSVPGNSPVDFEQAERTPLNPSKRARGEPEAEEQGGKSLMQTIVSIGSSLLIVLGLFLGVAWCYKKTLSTSIGGGLPKQVVSVLGRTPIAARQQLVLVRFGPKLVLVSLVQGEARTISEIADPLQVDQLAGLCESGQPDSISNSFRSILNQGGTV